jgi:Spy/CpxP family protein refolding chaperone
MRICVFLISFSLLAVFLQLAAADESLHSSLALSMEQARSVEAIQAEYRRTFSAKREVFNRESRKLRRARLAKDSAAIAQQEPVVAGLQNELRRIRESENDAIRKVLTPEQQKKFEAVLVQRRAQHGPSRDERLL